MGKASTLMGKMTGSRSASPDATAEKANDVDAAAPDLPTDDAAPGDLAAAPESLDMGEGNPDSDQGKLKQLLGVLKKSLGVKDLAAVRLSLPANLLEPIGNLEHWHYQSRPDIFAAIGDSDDSLERMLAVVRYAFTKDLKHAREGVCKPYNSALGEQFRSIWDVQPAHVDPQSGTLQCFDHLDPEHRIIDPAANLSRTSVDDDAASISSKRSSRIGKPASTKSSPGTGAVPDAKLKSPSDQDLAEQTKSKLTISSASDASSFASTSTAPTDPSFSSDGPKLTRPSGSARVIFINEQVSHHPPISAFWNEVIPADEGGQRVIALGYDQISAKFTGTSVKVFAGPSNKGIFVQLPDRDGEEYQITHPTASVSGFFRGTLYISVSDFSYITCLSGPKGRPRLRTILNYIDESWIGKARYAVEGIIYEYEEGEAESCAKAKQVPADRIVAKLSGSWRGKITYTLTRGDDTSEKLLIDLSALLVVPKQVRPMPSQGGCESRRFWHKVSDSIHKKEFGAATKHKQAIEQAQRDAAAARTKKGETWKAAFFGTEVEADGRPFLSEGGKRAREEEINGLGYEP